MWSSLIQKIKARGRRIADKLVRVGMPGIRPVLILDEHQWSWINLGLSEVFFAGLRRGIWFRYYAVQCLKSSTLDAPDSPLLEIGPNTTYRGVQLFPAIEYVLCVELEILPAELDWKLPAHQEAVARWYEIARRRVDEVEMVFRRIWPRAVVFLQGHFVTTAVARQIAAKFNVQCLALENTFQSDRLICEPYTGIAVNRTSAGIYYRQRQEYLPDGDYLGWLDQYLESLDKFKSGQHATPTHPFSWPDRRKRVVFLGQCYTDSSVVFGIRDRATTTTILSTLLTYAATRDVFVLAKLHPKENSGMDVLGKAYNRLTWRKIMAAPELAGRLSHCGPEHGWELDEDNRYSTARLLDDADVVVTINSQGGLEALSHGTNVVLMGDAFYANMGFTFDVPKLALMPVILDAILFQGVSLVDREQVARYLYAYFQGYCVERTPAAFAQAVADRLLPRGRFSAAFRLPTRPPGSEAT